MKDAWAILALYREQDMVRRMYEERHGGALNSTTGHSIASHFAQGREYFRSAANAAILVRPLLLHYGVVALSRASF